MASRFTESTLNTLFQRLCKGDTLMASGQLDAQLTQLKGEWGEHLQWFGRLGVAWAQCNASVPLFQALEAFVDNEMGPLSTAHDQVRVAGVNQAFAAGRHEAIGQDNALLFDDLCWPRWGWVLSRHDWTEALCTASERTPVAQNIANWLWVHRDGEPWIKTFRRLARQEETWAENRDLLDRLLRTDPDAQEHRALAWTVAWVEARMRQQLEGLNAGRDDLRARGVTGPAILSRLPELALVFTDEPAARQQVNVLADEVLAGEDGVTQAHWAAQTLIEVPQTRARLRQHALQARPASAPRTRRRS